MSLFAELKRRNVFRVGAAGWLRVMWLPRVALPAGDRLDCGGMPR
jgi:hypothetical protein